MSGHAKETRPSNATPFSSLGTLDAAERGILSTYGFGMARWVIWVAAGAIVLITVFGVGTVRQARGDAGDRTQRYVAH